MSQFNIGVVMLAIWGVAFMLVSFRHAIRQRIEALAFAIVWAGVVRRRQLADEVEDDGFITVYPVAA